MNMPISHAEQQTLLEKRQRLFALWTHAAPAPEAAMGGGTQPAPAPAARPAPMTVVVRPQQAPQVPRQARGPSDEVRALLQKLTNPDTDRWPPL